MAINYDQAKWGDPVFGTPGGTVEWSFARLHAGLDDTAPNGNAPAYAQTIRAAFDFWESVARIDIVEVAATTSIADITVGWGYIDGFGGTLGNARWQGYQTANGAYRTEAVVTFEEMENWNIGGGSVDFRAVALHEIGHALGLGHSSNPASLMYPYLNEQRAPIAEDIAAMREIYGARPTTGPTGGATVDAGDIFRFYDTRTGTHFFTASAQERDTILATLPNYRFEGNSFDQVDDARGEIEVFRFFNTSNGTHFYTASAAERDNFIATLSNYNYEGAVYKASLDNANNTLDALHRFYDTRSGTHFYTSDEAEVAQILGTLPNYQHEGIAYYVDFA